MENNEIMNNEVCEAEETEQVNSGSNALMVGAMGGLIALAGVAIGKKVVKPALEKIKKLKSQKKTEVIAEVVEETEE